MEVWILFDLFGLKNTVHIQNNVPVVDNINYETSDRWKIILTHWNFKWINNWFKSHTSRDVLTALARTHTLRHTHTHTQTHTHAHTHTENWDYLGTHVHPSRVTKWMGSGPTHTEPINQLGLPRRARGLSSPTVTVHGAEAVRGFHHCTHASSLKNS